MDMHDFVRSGVVLSAEEERVATERFVKTGDDKAKEQIILHSIKYIGKLARNNFPSMSFEDMVQEGIVGALKALDKFDPERGVRFLSFAKWDIDSSMRKHFLRYSKTVRTFNGSRRHKKVNQLLWDIKVDDKDLTDEQYELLSEHANTPVHDVRMMMANLFNPMTSYFELSSSEEASANGVFQVASDTNLEQEVVDFDLNLFRRAELNRELLNLNKRWKDILVSRNMVDKPATLAELSDKYGISQERVRQLEKKAIEKVRAGVAQW